MAQDKKNKIKTHWPNCSVCQFIRRYPDFKEDLKASTYFTPTGQEGAASVMKRWSAPFTNNTLYKHIQNHMGPDIEEAKKHNAVATLGKEQVDIIRTNPEDAHIKGLDEVIAKGREMLATGRLQITSQTLLTAIKIKADVEEKNKDRKLDAMKMMVGAYGGKSVPGATSEDK